MEKKIAITFLFLLLILPIVIGETSGGELIGKKGDCISLPQECSDCTFIKITTITLPNISKMTLQTDMDKNGTSYSYNFCNTTTMGIYSYCSFGDVSGTNTTACNDFEITYYGKKLSSSQSFLYLGLMGVLFFVFIITFFGIGLLPKDNNKDEQGRLLSINYLKYLRGVLWMFEWMLFIGILFLSSNIAFAFLEEQLFSKLLHALFQIFFGLTPLIVVIWLISFFIKFFHDKEFQRLLNKGMFEDGRF